MAYQSKYTGLQIDDILDSVEWKQGKIEDLASIRAGAQKGATALQSYTEKYTGTVTGIKINGVVKSGSGVIDLGTISTDISGKQDKLVDGVNIATINGQSLTAGGDLTIESGAKIYELDLIGGGENGSITEEEWNILKDVDTLKIKSDIGSFLVHKTSPSIFIMLGEDVRLFSSLEMTGVVGEENRPIFSAQTFIFFGPTVDTPLTYGILYTVTPTKTSQLENDSNFITSEDVAAVALSGSYNDLQDTPTIPSAVTESTVSGWGFTKNTGTYSKPSGGIPKSDLASAVQTSLGKADTALQSYTEQYKGTITGVSANGTSVATSGVANIPAASTSAYGVTKLNSSTSSTSTTEAATPSAVKSAYDLANSYKGTVTSVKVDNVSKTPSSGAVDLGYVNKKLTTSTSSSMTLSPNIYYRNTSTTLSTLTITLGGVSNSNIINEYFVEFTTRSAGTTVSLPSTIKWANGEVPTFEASTTYQISIVNNLGVVQKFK